MKRAVFLTFVLCLLIVATVSLVEADDDPKIISPYIGGPVYEADVGQEVIIRIAWAVCNRGLAEAFTHAASISMDVDRDGSPWLTVEPPSRSFWSPLQTSPKPSGINCVMRTDVIWWTEWLYSLGALEVGSYDVHFSGTLAHPLPDGADHDGDGAPDVFSGESFNSDYYFTIVVESE